MDYSELIARLREQAEISGWPRMELYNDAADALERLRSVYEAAKNLRAVKGRHQSEIATNRLFEAIDAAIAQEGK